MLKEDNKKWFHKRIAYKYCITMRFFLLIALKKHKKNITLFKKNEKEFKK